MYLVFRLNKNEMICGKSDYACDSSLCVSFGLTIIKQTVEIWMFFKKSCKNILSVHRKAIPLHSLFRKTHGQAL